MEVTHKLSDVVYAADYYPYGLTLAGREIKQEVYRHKSSGEFAEKDEETGWNSYEARMYDARIGRWLSVDPARQFASPYVGIGNNPVFINKKIKNMKALCVCFFMLIAPISFAQLNVGLSAGYGVSTAHSQKQLSAL